MDDFGNKIKYENPKALGQYIWWRMNYYGMFDASYWALLED